MDLNTVLLFIKVVQTGGFTAAAKATGLPKSTVSREVAMHVVFASEKHMSPKVRAFLSLFEQIGAPWELDLRGVRSVD